MSTIDRRSAGAGDPYYAEAASETAYDAAYEENGWLMFAALIILFTGLWNMIEGFIGFFRSAFFTGTPVVGALWFWATVWIGIGILEVAAGYGIMGGRGWARWFGIVVVGISALTHMLGIAAYPWWSLFILTIDIVILYALAVHWPRHAPALEAG